ncbi:flippase [Chitinophaga horti]|uniref:Flippase n=1 Tax=Chitinophaga horti TaxID=2920382 RepID=A0ABY6J6D3_9BACT|nr:flippase [Chitinophaga horti]UYQ95241.1 flippase [Chitinophaga horti]
MSEKKYAYWLKSGVYSGLQKLTVVLFGFGTVMLLTRSTDPADMGVWSLFLIFIGYIETIRSSLIKNAVIKYLNSSEKSEHVYVNSAALCLNIAITVAMAALLAAFILPLSIYLNAPALTQVIYIFLPGLLLLIPFSHFEWVQNANADFKGVFWAYMIRQGTSFVLIVADYLIHKHVTLLSLIIYYNAGIVLGTIISYFFARRFLLKQFRYSSKWLSTMWHFGKYVFGTNLSASVFRNTDQFIVSSLHGTGIVALYGVCVRISNLVDVPSQVLGDILFPKSAEVMKSGDLNKVKFYYEKAVGVVMAICIPGSLFIFLFPKFVLLVVGGDKYVEAAQLLQLTMAYGLFLPFIKQFGTIMDSTGAPKVNFLVMTVTAIVNIGICSVFARQFGIPGAAIGTMTSYFLCFLVTSAILHKRFNASIINCFRYMFQFYPEAYQLFQQRFLLKLKAR